jgi:enoyl-CoA hydratase
VGAGRARQLSFLSEVFDAREAYRIGLVNDVFPRADFTSRMEQILDRLTSARPAALLALKEHYVRAENMSVMDYADYETEWHIKNFTTEGLARFRSGREPSSRA